MRSSNAPEKLSIIRQASLDLMQQGRQSRVRVNAKLKLAARDNDYLLSIPSDRDTSATLQGLSIIGERLILKAQRTLPHT